MAYYGTVSGGDTFFASRLHSWDWENSSNADKLKALNQASQLIDQFDYQGQKYAITALGTEYTEAQLQAANVSQPLEFPRGDVNTVPNEVERAAYLIAKELLSGRDPNMELEMALNKNTRFGQLASSKDVEGKVLEHQAHLIPSPEAWNLIKPFLRFRSSFCLRRDG